jgi:hypothetical protein
VRRSRLAELGHRWRQAVATAGGLATLALVPAAAARADVVALARTTVSAGPTLAGQAVVWGAPAGGPGFSIHRATPGSPATTLYSAPAVPRDEEIAPLGLDGSPTQVAVAYAIESLPTGNDDAPSPLSVDLLGGPIAGPLRRLASLSVPTDEDLEPAAIGLTGDNVVLAEPADQFGATEHAHVQNLATGLAAQDIGPVGIDGLDVAGPYIASSSSTHGARIAVTDLAGAAVYSVTVPESKTPGLSGGCQSATGTTIGFAACGYAIGADGTLAVAVETAVAHGTGRPTYALYWASPAQPQLHPTALTASSSILTIAADRIVYVTRAGPSGEQLSLTDLTAASRPVSFQFPDDSLSGLVFDGTNLAWSTADCVYAGQLSPAAPTAPPLGTCSQDEFSIGLPVLAHDRVVPVKVACQMAASTGCRGTITLTAKRRGSRRPVTVATARFSVALNATHTVRVRIPAARLAGLRVIRATTFNRHQHPRAVVLETTARTTDAAGLHKVRAQQAELAL